MSEINPALRDHLKALAAKARLREADLWDVLNAAGLLFTEDVRRRQRWHALQSAYDYLDGLSVPIIIGQAYREGRTTPKDMRRGLMEHLETRVQQAKEGKA